MHWLAKQAPYFCWKSLSSIIASIFLAVATSAQSLILASLTASFTASGNSAMSASSTSCFIFPALSIHPMAFRTQSSVSISSIAEAFISSIEGHEASQLSKPNGFWEGFLEGFLAGFLEGFLEGFFEGFLDGFFEGFLDGFFEGFFDFENFFDFEDFFDFEGIFLEGFFPFIFFISFFLFPLSEGSSKSKALPELSSFVSGDIDIACISSTVAAIICTGRHCFSAASIFSCSLVPIPQIMCTSSCERQRPSFSAIIS